jgi:hypothetical protein
MHLCQLLALVCTNIVDTIMSVFRLSSQVRCFLALVWTNVKRTPGRTYVHRTKVAPPLKSSNSQENFGIFILNLLQNYFLDLNIFGFY